MTNHTKGWYREKTQRPQPKELKVFYHIACMGNWREVVAEQLAMLKRADLHPAAFVLGTSEEVAEVSELCEVIGSTPHIEDCETPTLGKVWEYAKANPDAAVIYLHTKGVSKPECEGRVYWRRLMALSVIERWKKNLDHLRSYDFVGVGWMSNHEHHFFCGNFWMARCDWLAQLTDPREYKLSRSGSFLDIPWSRMHAEMWLGSKQGYRFKSLLIQNADLLTMSKELYEKELRKL